MSETTPEAPGRVFARFTDDDAGEVSLPGYLDALPSIVSPGDVFHFDGAHADEVFATGRFEPADEPAEASPNAGLTKRELAAKLNAGLEEFDPDFVNADDYTKDELVALADEYDKTHPEPIGSTGDNAGDGDQTEGNDS